MKKLIVAGVVAWLVAACAERTMEPTSLAPIDGASVLAQVGPPHTCCFEDGRVLRTVVPPSPLPNGGRDPIYSFTNGAEGQLPVAGVGPGSGKYHGGAWAVHLVAWNTTPYLITSDEELFAAEDAGDVTITRVPEADFRCPVQP